MPGQVSVVETGNHDSGDGAVKQDRQARLDALQEDSPALPGKVRQGGLQDQTKKGGGPDHDGDRQNVKPSHHQIQPFHDSGSFRPVACPARSHRGGRLRQDETSYHKKPEGRRPEPWAGAQGTMLPPPSRLSAGGDPNPWAHAHGYLLPPPSRLSAGDDPNPWAHAHGYLLPPP